MPDSITARLLARATREPDRAAVHLLGSTARGRFRDEPVTLGEWSRGAGNCAAALVASGLRRGDRVLLCVPTGRAFLDGFLGASLIGAVPVPLPSLDGFARPTAFVNRLASVVRDAAPSAVFADRRTAAHLRQSGLLNQGLPVIEPRSLAHREAPEARPATGDEPALIQYTSGSTGTPRGVVITAANLAANVDAMARALRLTAEDRVVSWLPLYHDMGLIGGLLALVAHGATSWLLSPLEFARSRERRRACGSGDRRGLLRPLRADGLPALGLLPGLWPRRVHPLGDVPAARQRSQGRPHPARGPGEGPRGPGAAGAGHDGDGVGRLPHRRTWSLDRRR